MLPANRLPNINGRIRPPSQFQVPPAATSTPLQRISTFSASPSQQRNKCTYAVSQKGTSEAQLHSVHPLNPPSQQAPPSSQKCTFAVHLLQQVNPPSQPLPATNSSPCVLVHVVGNTEQHCPNHLITYTAPGVLVPASGKHRVLLLSHAHDLRCPTKTNTWIHLSLSRTLSVRSRWWQTWSGSA
eukprot:1160915-Pelagomonas_calceolata.AAC.6